MSRTLIVLGGAVAATAAAWLVSSATAAADQGPVNTGPLGQPVPAVTSLLGHAVAIPAVSTVPVVPVADRVRPALPLPTPADLPTALRTAVRGIGAHATPAPAGVTATPVASPASAPVPVPLAPVRPSAATLPATTPTTAPVGARPTMLAGRSTNRPATSPSGPAVPLVPGRTVLPTPPFSPITVPAAPGSTGEAGGGQPAPSGPGLAETAGGPAVPGRDGIQPCPATAPLRQLTTGKQPGSTPD